MILKNNLYKVKSSLQSDEGFEYQIFLNADCVIYKAHFPGQPITPGVCIIQIAQELYELETTHVLSIAMIKNVKFLSIMKPEQGKSFVYKFRKISEERELVRFQVSVTSEETTFAKMSLVCIQS